MCPGLSYKPVPGIYLTGIELFRLACDRLGFSWRLVNGGVAVRHGDETIMVVASVQAARGTICELAIGLLKDAPTAE